MGILIGIVAFIALIVLILSLNVWKGRNQLRKSFDLKGELIAIGRLDEEFKSNLDNELSLKQISESIVKNLITTAMTNKHITRDDLSNADFAAELNKRSEYLSNIIENRIKKVFPSEFEQTIKAMINAFEQILEDQTERQKMMKTLAIPKGNNYHTELKTVSSKLIPAFLERAYNKETLASQNVVNMVAEASERVYNILLQD